MQSQSRESKMLRHELFFVGSIKQSIELNKELTGTEDMQNNPYPRKIRNGFENEPTREWGIRDGEDDCRREGVVPEACCVVG